MQQEKFLKWQRMKLSRKILYNFFHLPQAVLIRLGSLTWSGLNRLSRLLLKKGFLHSTRLGVRVVSVGNIQSGGAGKTPLAAHLAQEAHERGLRVCILTRGYQSPSEKKGGVITPQMGLVDAFLFGDEPTLLHDLCPFAYIGIGGDRLESFSQVSRLASDKREPIDLVILDDGFQHWKIQKDLEIVALTSKTPWQVVFRETYSALNRADLVLWTKGNRPPIQKGKSMPPMVQVQYRIPPAEQESIWLVTGVADGNSVAELAAESGYHVKNQIHFKDHTAYDLSSVQSLLSQAAQDHCKIAVTAKDWVKWRSLGITRTQVRVLELRLDFIQGKETWRQVIWGAEVNHEKNTSSPSDHPIH